MSAVELIDSTGAGWLEWLQKSQNAAKRQMVLVAVPLTVRNALATMLLNEMMPEAPTFRTARRMIAKRRSERHVVVGLNPARTGLEWHGEIIASTSDEVWRITVPYVKIYACHEKRIDINIEDVRFIDSTGVSLMIKVRKLGAPLGLAVVFSTPPPIVENAIRILRAYEFLFDNGD